MHYIRTYVCMYVRMHVSRLYVCIYECMYNLHISIYKIRTCMYKKKHTFKL